MFKQLKKRSIYKYYDKFGLQGLWIFYWVRRSKKEVISFKLPQFKHVITLRRNHSDIVIFEEIFIKEIYQLTNYRKIDTIIDAGANVGLATLYFIYKYQPKLIICVEPNEENFRVLKENLSNCDSVLFYKKALWHSESYLKFKSLSADSWAFEVLETLDVAEAEVAAISLDDIIKQNKLDAINLLKVDIEGSEKEVFEAHNGWINLVNNLIVEVHENMRPGAEKAVFSVTERHMELVSSFQDNFVFTKRTKVD